jgi:hypothetical protein
LSTAIKTSDGFLLLAAFAQAAPARATPAAAATVIEIENLGNSMQQHSYSFHRKPRLHRNIIAQRF